MEKTVVVLQSEEAEAEEVACALDGNFHVSGYSCDAENIVSIVKENKIDFLITSLMLKNDDGIDVIKRVKEISPNTFIIVLTAISNWERVKEITDFDFDYCMIKPVNYPVLIERMKGMYEKREQNENDCGIKEVQCESVGEKIKINERAIDERISRIFIGIGIPPHIKGYGYLREGIKLAVTNPEIINCVTKELYPSIGNKFGTSASKVERAIRHAIEVAWNKGRIESFNALFGVRAYSENEKPTNSEFIALIADRLLLDGIS